MPHGALPERAVDCSHMHACTLGNILCARLQRPTSPTWARTASFWPGCSIIVRFLAVRIRSFAACDRQHLVLSLDHCGLAQAALTVVSSCVVASRCGMVSFEQASRCSGKESALCLCIQLTSGFHWHDFRQVCQRHRGALHFAAAWISSLWSEPVQGQSLPFPTYLCPSPWWPLMRAHSSDEFLYICVPASSPRILIYWQCCRASVQNIMGPAKPIKLCRRLEVLTE